MKLAVIGAGIFGSTIAIKLAKDGFKVDLYEKEPDILQAASGINQYRLHRGYHYPRSSETAASLLGAERSFLAEYGDAVHTRKQYYAIAREGSKTSAQQFKAFCKRWNLEHSEESLGLINKDSVDLIVRARESLIDPIKLRAIIRTRLKKSNVNLLLNTLATPAVTDTYDLVINCTYATLNYLLQQTPQARQQFQYELCEKPVLRLPRSFKGIGIVILDGPFTCIDPYADTDFHVIGHVVHAIHATNTGLFPVVPKEFESLLNKGIVKNPPITRIKTFLEAGSRFMPELKKAEHIGSMYTFRTVLPNVDHTDERPTIVRKVTDKIINVFSGKIPTCVQAAEQVVHLVTSADRGARGRAQQTLHQ